MSLITTSSYQNSNQIIEDVTMTETEVKLDISSLPDELLNVIFTYLPGPDLGRCQLVCRDWKERLASNDLPITTLWKRVFFGEVAFGKQQWAKYFGDVGDEPPLPDNIHAILSSKCPIWPDKYVAQTHMLVLIPATIKQTTVVDGKETETIIPLTLNSLGTLMKAYKKLGYTTQYDYINFGAVSDHSTTSPNKSSWVLMTKDVIPESRSKSYDDQKAQVLSLCEKSTIEYQLPNVLDAATCIFMKYVTSGICLYSDDPWTYTHCLEQTDGPPIAVGCFTSLGLNVG
ncbi:MAG: F-box-like domain-containing protein, partial [Candidatus Saccharimonadales bacterium]